MTGGSLAHHQAAARDQHHVPARQLHLPGMRGYRFCEVGLITGTSQDNAIANIWNTTGACDPEPGQVGALDAATVARENGALNAWLNPVRHWMFDRLDVWEAGDDKTFGDLTGTWMGVAGAAAMKQATGQGSFSPGYLYRNSTFTFSEGSEVYLLDAPDGEVFIMESAARPPDPAPGGDALAHLGSRLDLPEGWDFRAVTADRELAVSTAGHDHLAHVLQDNLHNRYQGSDAGRAFTYLCPEDARW